MPNTTDLFQKREERYKELKCTWVPHGVGGILHTPRHLSLCTLLMMLFSNHGALQAAQAGRAGGTESAAAGFGVDDATDRATIGGPQSFQRKAPFSLVPQMRGQISGRPLGLEPCLLISLCVSIFYTHGPALSLERMAARPGGLAQVCPCQMWSTSRHVCPEISHQQQRG